jgi:ATP-dependent RNA helicase YTHDC2
LTEPTNFAISFSVELNRYITIAKNPANIFTIPINNLDLHNSSKKVACTLFQRISQEHDTMKDFLLPAESKMTLDIRAIDSKNSSSVITVPPKRRNPACVKTRQELPIFKHRSEVLSLIQNNQIVIVESTTGSGKSTQIPQYILENAAESGQKCRTIVAEPRRICAVSLAERVSYERDEPLGSTVGYQIRLESKVAPTSNLIYVTSGIILRMLMNGKPEKFFSSITHLVIDEVHERDKFTDFLLLCVREFLDQLPNVRVIIMSATVDSSLFAKYFGGCPVLKIEGQSYPVREKFLEDILKDINFSNARVRELEERIKRDPDFLNKVAEESTEQRNEAEETLEMVKQLLDKISLSSDCEQEFSSLAYLIRVGNVDPDTRHETNGKTGLIFAVEYGLIPQVTTLLNLKANLKLTANINGQEMNAFNIAVAKSNEMMVGVMMKHMELLDGPTKSGIGELVETSPYDRKILDIYYDTLIEPGVHRGQFLEDVVDLSLIVRIIARLHSSKNSENAILVFLPGHDEIIQLANLLVNALDDRIRIFILHSQMMTNDQQTVFDEMPPGIRKIIIATNIAESSITVNDVVSFSLVFGKIFSNRKSFVGLRDRQWKGKEAKLQRRQSRVVSTNAVDQQSFRETTQGQNRPL